MSQHQAEISFKRLKQTAMTWKVKDKATSQLARSDARLAVSGVNQGGQRETVLPKFWLGAQQCWLLTNFRLRRVSAGSFFVSSQKGISHFIIFKQSVLGSSYTYIIMTSVGSRGASLPHKNIIKNSYLFILKQWYPTQQKINEMNGAHSASPIRRELGYAHWPQLGTQFIALLGTRFGAH